MASPEAFDAFSDRLGDWTDAPVVFENDAYDLPDTPAPFVFVEIVGDTYEQDTMGAPGANMWLERGVAYLHVMTPAGTGSRAGRVLANDLLYLFREQPIDTLFMPEMSIGAGEPGRDFAQYFAITATIIWQRRDITSIP